MEQELSQRAIAVESTGRWEGTSQTCLFSTQDWWDGCLVLQRMWAVFQKPEPYCLPVQPYNQLCCPDGHFKTRGGWYHTHDFRGLWFWGLWFSRAVIQSLIFSFEHDSELRSVSMVCCRAAGVHCPVPDSTRCCMSQEELLTWLVPVDTQHVEQLKTWYCPKANLYVGSVVMETLAFRVVDSIGGKGRKNSQKSHQSIFLQNGEVLPLKIVTYTTVSISLVALLITFILLVLIRTLRSNLHSIHKNLVAALFFSELVFLIGINQTENPVRVTLHSLLELSSSFKLGGSYCGFYLLPCVSPSLVFLVCFTWLTVMAEIGLYLILREHMTAALLKAYLRNWTLNTGFLLSSHHSLFCLALSVQ